jgi:malate dehydrogenase (oxaloacetate-decarboxylating)(NADP+)
MQADTAVMADIIEERYPFSAGEGCQCAGLPFAGSANIAYKLLARLGNAKAIGPILLGIGAPVHVLQTGDEVQRHRQYRGGGSDGCRRPGRGLIA